MMRRRNLLVISKVKGLSDHIGRKILPVLDSESKSLADHYNLWDVDEGFLFGARQMHKEVDAIVADPNHEFLLANIDTKFPNLKFLQSTFAGVNSLVNGSKRRDYVCSRIGTGFGNQMVEYVFAHILQHSSHMDMAIAAHQSAKQWQPDAFSQKSQLSGKVLGLMGVGDIGKSIARVGKVLDMQIIGLCRESRTNSSNCSSSSSIGKNVNSGNNKLEEMKLFDCLTTSIDEILRESDYIVNCLPSTPHTKNLINKNNLAKNLYNRPKPPPLFCNVGRGDIISEADILFALNSKLFAKACLDVFEVEPLPQTSKLWTHPLVRITPHVSAISTIDIVSNVLAQNLDRYSKNLDLLYKVDFNHGY